MARSTAVRLARHRRNMTAEIAYHIVANADRWDVERNGTLIWTVVADWNVALKVAVGSAMRDYLDGHGVSVCVEDENGQCRHVWP